MTPSEYLTHEQIQAAKQLAVDKIVEPFTKWCDEVCAGPHNRELAFTTMADLLGHLLAGAAEELSIGPDPVEVGVLVGTTMAEQMGAS